MATRQAKTKSFYCLIHFYKRAKSLFEKKLSETKAGS